ncbi:MAG: prepilin-type N-terminal cleavage/methylation domain-containing protein [Lachnospiraceae bacterium]|nr:prepilin-type N-terminal cleavage/methylation domain-containing protein [Lachnospiraceae bacterium]
MKNNKGFSLVELIIVVAIMAVLMGILAPQYIRYVEKTRIRADDSIISDMDKAASALLADEKYYTKASNTVVVTMTHATGAVSVSGLGSMATTFVNEMHTSLYGQTGAVNKFKSKAYAGTATSTATYTWTQSLYTWTKSVVNGITDSKYETAQTT